MGDVCQIPLGLRCCLGQRQVLLRPDPAKIDARFLLFALQSPYLQRQIGWNEGTGSTVGNLRIPVLEALRVPTPPLRVQIEIAKALGALDDRIALLRETNAALEAIAQALFKSWFVDFDPVRAKQQGLAPAGMDEATAALFPDGFEESAVGLVPIGWRVGTLGDVSLNPRHGAKPENCPVRATNSSINASCRRPCAVTPSLRVVMPNFTNTWSKRRRFFLSSLVGSPKCASGPTAAVCAYSMAAIRAEVFNGTNRLRPLLAPCQIGRAHV